MKKDFTYKLKYDIIVWLRRKVTKMKKRVLMILTLGLAFLIIGCKNHEHNWDSEWTIDKEATCTEEGSKSYHCSGCSEKKDVTIISVKEHNYGQWNILEDATETKTGLKERTCQICNKKETEVIDIKKHEHTFSNEWTIDNEKHYHKSTCEHDLYKDEAEHTFIDEKENKVCSVCGYMISYIVTEEKWINELSKLDNYTLFVNEYEYGKYTKERYEFCAKETISNGESIDIRYYKLIQVKEDDVYAMYSYSSIEDRWTKDINYEDEMGSSSSIFDLIINEFKNATFNIETKLYEVSVKIGDVICKYELHFESGNIISGKVISSAKGIDKIYYLQDVNKTVVEIPTYTPTSQEIWENAFNNKHMRNFTMTLTNQDEVAIYKSVYVDGNHIVQIDMGDLVIIVKTKDGKLIQYEKNSDGSWEKDEITENVLISLYDDLFLSYAMLCPNFRYEFDKFSYDEKTNSYIFDGEEGKNEITTNLIGEDKRGQYYKAIVKIENGRLVEVCAYLSNQGNNPLRKIVFSDYDSTSIEVPNI